MNTPDVQTEIASPASYRLILVLDPTSKAKNALLERWIQANRYTTAWLRLDASANEPNHFLALIQDGLSSIGFPKVLGANTSTIPLESGIVHMLNATLAGTTDTYLILDNYHAITNPTIHQAIAWMLDYLPDKIHLILTCQTAPPLPLARLRLRRQLLEIYLG